MVRRMDYQEREPLIGILVLSPIRIYREGLSRVLAEESAVRVLGAAATPEDAEALLEDTNVNVVLIDISTDPNLAALRQLARHDGLRVIALGVAEHREHGHCMRRGRYRWIRDTEQFTRRACADHPSCGAR